MNKNLFFIYCSLLISTNISINSFIKPNERMVFRNFGGWSINQDLFDYIKSVVPKGGTILELGSGWGSGQLSKYFTVYSVEHDKKWVNKYDTNYIYAPIKNGWYDVDILKIKLPVSYDLLLVDGPTGAIGRGKFLKFISLFKTDISIVFDDVDRPEEFNLMVAVAKELGREYTIYGTNKLFGVV